MAVRLASAGIPLTVLARHEAGRLAATSAGARVAVDTRELAQAAEIIGICVRDEAQLDHVLAGDGGFYSVCRPDTLLVIHSTIPPSAAVRIAREAADRGLRVIDAPVSGLPVRARAGELTIYVGGSKSDIEQARPGLEAMGRKILHMGAVGTGQTTKIIGNMFTIDTVALAAEAVQLGVASGIDQSALLEALQAGPADSFTLRQFDNFQARWTAKGGAQAVRDGLGLVLGLARSVNVEASLTSVAVAVLPGTLAKVVPERVTGGES